MKMLRILMLLYAIAVLVACQDEVGSSLSDVSATEVSVSEINAESLPTNAQSYISDNFVGEVVTQAYEITEEGEVSYEAYLTNSMNLQFSEEGNLEGFSENAPQVDCGGKPRGGKGHRGPGHGPERPKPTELELGELPTIAADYLTTNYADSAVLKVLFIEHEEITEYHVLVEGVGAVIFDADGNFVEVKEKPVRPCGHFEALAIEDLSTEVTDYISANYPDSEILKARVGTRNEVTEIHVLVDEVGALIFDESENFVELKTCGMNKE